VMTSLLGRLSGIQIFDRLRTKSGLRILGGAALQRCGESFKRYGGFSR
jgi:hypothetical protein